MSGHGHVIPNPDGSKARCGGPAICSVCARESASIKGRPEVIRLLQEIDGHLGLAVYRNEHDERWKDEAKELISRIRQAVVEDEKR